MGIADPELRAILERTSGRYFVSERRKLAMDPQPVHQPVPPVRPANLGERPCPLPVRLEAHHLDHHVADFIFISFNLRAVPWLSGLNMATVKARGYTRRICREAVAGLMSKWPGQVHEGDAALFFGIADALKKGRPSQVDFKFVRECEVAMAFLQPLVQVENSKENSTKKGD